MGTEEALSELWMSPPQVRVPVQQSHRPAPLSPVHSAAKDETGPPARPTAHAQASPVPSFFPTAGQALSEFSLRYHLQPRENEARVQSHEVLRTGIFVGKQGPEEEPSGTGDLYVPLRTPRDSPVC